ncbi:LacI family DNA-binding transcriptional regulator [Neolewinella persica]|uniref:LacI family DNA-binding transcriptional regulator n=1 Tax=Neolewinella persica TaxID=70998 RepID=UPI00036DA220|nr:LacI family DNA-binding transcriptional regulator [Neolewinella persica]
MAKKSGKITIHDIAYELGLNASTVSRALADNPVVSQKTRDLVRAKAAALNYQPNRIAAALRRGRSDILGVIVPALDRAFFGKVIRGIEEKAGKAGFHIIVCQSYDSAKRERAMVDTLRRLQVDGIMVSVAKDKEQANNVDFYQNVIASGFPIHFFDTIAEGVDAPVVVIDNEQGGFEATSHLIKAGYQRIAHLRGPQHVPIYRDRYLGYIRAMEAGGLTVDPGYVIDIVSHFDNGEEAFLSLWDLTQPPDAVFSSSDYSAAAGIKASEKHGIRVPEDLAIIGFSNESFTEIITPNLSTVDQQTLEMGRRTAERMIAVVAGNATSEDMEQRLVLAPRVIVRGSSSVL